jgi:hypothetical protein
VQKRASRILPRHLHSPPRFRDHDMRTFRGIRYEQDNDDKAHFSAEQSTSKEEARLPSADEDEVWPRHPEGAPRQGSNEALRVALRWAAITHCRRRVIGAAFEPRPRSGMAS